MAATKGTEGRKKRSRQESNLSSNIVDEDVTDPSSNEDEDKEDLVDESEELDSDEEFQGENPADKRRRLAKQYLENLKSEANEILSERANTDEKDNALDDFNNFDAADMDKDIIASRLKQDVAEQQGKVYRFIANKLLVSESKYIFTRVGDKNLTCISCYQPPLNTFSHDISENKSNKKNKIFAYTVSKDLQLTKYDVTDFNHRPKKIKQTKGGSKYIPTTKFEHENTTEGHYDEILTVAASPDGKYVITGGRDRKLIIWSTESLSPVKVIPTKDRNGQVMSLTFRKNSDQLYVACADYKIRTYSINQFAQTEILYGHHDLVADISSLGMERCVTVGSRDRTAMLWKIPDETRLTFRGGDDPARLVKNWLKQNASEDSDGNITYPDASEAPLFYGEGSIDIVSMIDDSHFITGSDNGNICLWSLAKKKPLFIVRAAHGIVPHTLESNISGETDQALRTIQLQGNKITKPYWITALYAIPYSDVFISGSWNGTLKVWKIGENLREFELLGELDNCRGVVNKIQVVEQGKHGKETFRVLASVGKEHKLGRWLGKVPGARNGIYSAVLQQTSF
ncbi:hypothetical protein TBLA_0C05340 [Henningerozyma blattae CBS 6284]|uniref:Uncharacterized protein n=1 Tax=Henningerozyma blattae (strain ATCC 34711 / CBS 6284 / DSM 70876 / NBRC 10599 / NRRL Y-10934 / UCD 77-7) TaxID=1071380 RepID=I2H1S9_HENB6|nr:hypothetical protein TBLA_0C05340 [Tetrapisispora blattae CBS 6284]CCH60331.1 hypothetical protein TBLA_0C05340 [Tetrapisispora blattae CBS 6284]